MPTEKAQPREAAERVERGIELYGGGDLAGARREFEAALKLEPRNGRASEYLAWVRDLESGKRNLIPPKTVDDDGVRAVDEALEDEPPPARAAAPAPAAPTPSPPAAASASTTAGLDAQWDPVPLTPTGPESRSLAAAVQSSAAPPAESGRRSSNTLLGLAPSRSPRIAPVSSKAGAYDAGDPVTREWSSLPTGKNLLPIEVAELTEEQIAELAALDGPPADGERNTSVDGVRGIARESEESVLLELTAEPTPVPHRSPLEEKSAPPAAAQLQASEAFDAQEITRDRRVQQRAAGAPPRQETLADFPLRQLTESAEDTAAGTNPFVRSRLADYTPAPGPGPDLPPLPPLPGQTLGPAASGVSQVIDLLGKDDVAGALAAVERMVAAVGGIESSACCELQQLLEQVYEGAIGGLDRVPRHGKVGPGLDPRSAFLLSRVDGALAVEDLLDVSGMPRLQALRTLALMVSQGVVLV